MSCPMDCLPIHAICCIKQALKDCIEEHPLYLVFCDREDCWKENEVISGQRMAVNIVERGETVGDIKGRQAGESQKVREHRLQIEVQVYAIGCKDAGCDALSVLGDVQRQLCQKRDRIPVSRMIYEGMNRTRSVESTQDITQITARYSIEYSFSECSPNTLYGAKKTLTKNPNRGLPNGSRS